MTVIARTTVAQLDAGDVVVLLDDGQPFEVVATGEPVGGLRQLDVARHELPVRITLAVDHEVVVVGRSSTVSPGVARNG